jgi:hypothetical protein
MPGLGPANRDEITERCFDSTPPSPATKTAGVNFGARACVQAMIRNGQIEDRVYTDDEAQQLYTASFKSDTTCGGLAETSSNPLNGVRLDHD